MASHKLAPDAVRGHRVLRVPRVPCEATHLLMAPTLLIKTKKQRKPFQQKKSGVCAPHKKKKKKKKKKKVLCVDTTASLRLQLCSLKKQISSLSFFLFTRNY
eukprot:TRINITY_DN8952_c0_g1_i1.p2 TRINITY_DN8952_c0_g1~~TRINITY_DN8952_c0_g1_i1.p2  ORF type:complete len:102 (+),score=32.66 TRINITY_DN8952_c0_g1_i1:685-990(+)